MQPNESQKFAIARAHVNADSMSKTVVLLFNQAKNEAIVCCPLEKLKAELPFGLDEADIFYYAYPGKPVPAEIA